MNSEVVTGGTSLATMVTFVSYIAGVFLLAALSHRVLLRKTSFSEDFFLGGRRLGGWALAFTFAATGMSGGTFTGFPALTYSYGWVIALWIAGGLMVGSLTQMGVMGKRLNQMARKTGAITIPDVLRDRFESPALSLIATSVMILFTMAILVAQFRAGAFIIEQVFNLPAEYGFLLGLFIFAAVVTMYTAYGGFRAVVWTDVMQGIIMGIGVLILLPVILSHAGGLEKVNESIREAPPRVVTSISGPDNDLAFLLEEASTSQAEVAGVQYAGSDPLTGSPAVSLVEEGDEVFIEVRLTTGTTAREVRDAVLTDPAVAPFLADVELAYDNDGSGTLDTVAEEGDRIRYRFLHPESLLYGPGREFDGTPWLALGIAISFFAFGPIIGMGKPAGMVRLMAFRDSRTLKKAILIASVYHSVILVVLMLIFITAISVLPGHIPRGDSDRVMAIVATEIVANKGIFLTLLGAVILAAPFSAIMSTVDSFLLMISSGLVRDIYQRSINPHISERLLRLISYGTIVGVSAFCIYAAYLTRDTIDFLSYLIIIAEVGLASAFLVPMLMGLYWKRATREGALAAMAGGFLTTVALNAPVFTGGQWISLFGFHPAVWALVVSLVLGVTVSLATAPPPQYLVEKYFYRPVRGL